MIFVGGIGWIDNDRCGCVKKSLEIRKEEVLLYKPANFARFDRVSQTAAYSAALALKDAGIGYALGVKQNIGIIGANIFECGKSDILYFKDYLDNGRSLSRGNLFIYTLPSSHLSEVSIFLGLQGPLLYMSEGEKSLSKILKEAADMVFCNEANMMLAGWTEEDRAIYFVLGKKTGFKENILCGLDSVLNVLEQHTNFSETVEVLSALCRTVPSHLVANIKKKKKL